MILHIARDKTDLTSYVANWITAYIHEVLERQDEFTIALSGGNTPKALYELLASSAYRDKIEWGRIRFFWGDERYVPFTDTQNNAGMAFASLLDKVPVKPEQVHIMDTNLAPEQAADAYEQLLRKTFPNPEATFDLVLLGLGDNAHTLSLFPGYDVVMEKEKWVNAIYLQEQEIYRITLTAPPVNGAGRVVFLVSGGDKAASVYHVISGEHEPDLYPAQIIQPFNSHLFWFLDEAAAADLE